MTKSTLWGLEMTIWVVEEDEVKIYKEALTRRKQELAQIQSIHSTIRSNSLSLGPRLAILLFSK
jgi:hypothetical protein